MDIVLAVLKSGHSVVLPSTGYSMWPYLKPGDNVVVRALNKEEIPEKGTVLIYEDSGRLVMHRLVEIIYPSFNNLQFITRGDSMVFTDNPLQLKQILGVAISYRRGKIERQIKVFVPGTLRYKFNRRLLWVYAKTKAAVNMWQKLW